MNELHMTVSRATTSVTLTVAGELDMATQTSLIAFLKANLQAEDRHVALNLAGLTFFDAGGLGMLIGFRRLIRAQNADLVLVNSPACVTRVLEITGLRTYFTLAQEPEAKVQVSRG